MFLTARFRTAGADAVSNGRDAWTRFRTAVMWVKDLGRNTYLKYTFIIENGKVKKQQQVSITKEEAEEGARRVLRNLGYLQY